MSLDSDGLGVVASWPSAPVIRADVARTSRPGRLWLGPAALDRASDGVLDDTHEAGVRLLVAATRAERSTPHLQEIRSAEASSLDGLLAAARLETARMPADSDPCERCGCPLRLVRGVLRNRHAWCAP